MSSFQAAELTGPLQGLKFCCLSVKKKKRLAAVWQQPGGPAAWEGCGGISALLTQGRHCASDAAQASSEPSREGEAGAVERGWEGGDHKNLPTALSTRVGCKVVCGQKPIAPLCALSHPSSQSLAHGSKPTLQTRCN